MTAADAPRRLVLLRHAQAGDEARTDHARTLTERGRRQAGRVGTWLAASGVVPDQALVSDAARTVETETLVRGAAGWAVHATRALYEAGPEALLDEVRALAAPETRTLLVVGHNPTIAQLVLLLDDGTGTDATDVLRHGFPPSSAAVLEYEGPWERLAFGTARMVDTRLPADG